MAPLSRAFRRRYPHVAAAWRYCEDVLSGKVPACLYVRQACRRQLEDLERDEFPYYFDPEAAERVCRFVERLPHVKGEWAARGERLRLEPWQSFVLTTIFGWKHAEDVHDGSILVVAAGTRRFRTAYVEVPRKNSKSTVVAGVGLYMTSEDGESGAEVYSNATTRDQAKIVFETARQMALRADVGVGVRAHSLYHEASGSLFKPLHAQGETLDGYNIHCALNDEVHAWHNRGVYDVIETAMGARRQPLVFNITTAGDNLEGICFELRGYSIRILSGAVADETFFGVVYTIDEEDRDRWLEREVWRKANPNYGVSVYPMDLDAMAKKAREVPSEQNAFLTKRLDVWVNAAVAWMDLGRWQRCYDPTMRLEDFRGVPCYAGVDLASKIDVNSLAVLFEVEREGRMHYYAFTRHWLPEAAIAADRFGQYDGWVRMGAIKKTPGNVVDLDEMEADTLELARSHRLRELGVDPGHNSTQFGVHMAKAGIAVVDVRPTVLNFSEPMKWLEAWVKDGTFHFCDPVLTWMVSNVVARRDKKDNVYPDKESAVRKIDGVVALLIAINRLKGAVEAPKYQLLFV